MESIRIVKFFKNKSILVTGSTGFLAKIFVEKVLRVQPEVKKLFLLVRAGDAASANRRVQTEILEKDLFKVLKDKHGDGFHSFVASKLVPLAGDIVQEDLGIHDSDLRRNLWKEVEVVVNVAATTNFDERYDVALGINVLGAKHILEFAKRCVRLQMLLHVSTAYVAGVQSGLILEKKFLMGETLTGDSYLDIEAELSLADKKKRELRAEDATEEAEKLAMKELGINRAKLFGWPNTYVFTKAMGEMLLGHSRGDLPMVILRPTIITSVQSDPLPGWVEGTRTIDSVIIGYAKGKITCFFGDLDVIMDVVPGDMVVNAMMATMAAHSKQQAEFIYHMGSSVRNPVTYATLEHCHFRYFLANPRVGRDGSVMPTKRLSFIKSMVRFRVFMTLRYKLPLEVMHLFNLLSCGRIARGYNELNRKYKYVMYLVELYKPYAYFDGCFDDLNMERLRMAMKKDDAEAKMFDFDPKHIDWEAYFSSIHIPGVMKYAFK
ncbi:fatty acyl-CoA reductase 1-like [Musa acuminata AAA Group]|uniref:fatty acyl-CoA reductase 1-like n=1 Tax=Musa acuminata AAA Group TaxID=214697 RepID=UPI000295A1E1|nr:PREDICTED: fatty acyl-CoA reductase 1-like [Musa acuminata subsp. malaccensis]